MNETESKTVLQTMRACGIFEGLDEATLLLLRPTAKRVHQPRNTVVFHQGEACGGFYIVESGAVKLYKESADAKEHVLHIAHPGDCFGEAALFLGQGFPASAAAVQESELILFRKDDFLGVLRENPEACFALMASMASWSHRLVRSIESLTLKDASARFASYVLSRIHGDPQDGATVDLGMPKQVLASHLGMTGETLSRLLSRFEEEGLIQSRGKKVKVLSVGDLSEMAEYGRG